MLHKRIINFIQSLVWKLMQLFRKLMKSIVTFIKNQSECQQIKMKYKIHWNAFNQSHYVLQIVNTYLINIFLKSNILNNIHNMYEHTFRKVYLIRCVCVCVSS